MFLIMYQIFSSPQGHLRFSVQFFSQFYGVTFFGTPNILNQKQNIKNLSGVLVLHFPQLILFSFIKIGEFL